MTRRAIGYVRLSVLRGGEEDPATSPATQRDEIRRACDFQGWRLVDVVEDLDVSGSRRGARLDRPGLAAALARIDAGDADALVVARLDRLSRSVADFLAIHERVDAAGGVVFVKAENLDMSTAVGRFTATILAAFAEMEADTIAARVKSARRTMKAEGRFGGGPRPYGFRPVPAPDGRGTVLAVDEEEAAALREAWRQIREGRSRRSVADWLHANAPERPGGGPWSASALRQSLRSEAADRMLWSAGERRALRAAGFHSKRERAVTRVPSGPKGSRLLSGLVVCGSCRRPLRASSRSDGGGPVYRCQSRGEGYGCVRPVTVAAVSLERLVEAAYLDGHGSTPVLEALDLGGGGSDPEGYEDALAALWEALPGASPGERPALLAEVAALEARRDAERAPAVRVLVPSSERTNGDVWAAGGVPERRDLLARVLGGVPLTVLPAASRAPRLDASRVPDLARLYSV